MRFFYVFVLGKLENIKLNSIYILTVCNDLVAALATPIFSSSTIESCITFCPLAEETTALCGLKKINDNEFEYRDFIDGCALNSANCGVIESKSKFWSLICTTLKLFYNSSFDFIGFNPISEVGVTCLELAQILLFSFSI